MYYTIEDEQGQAKLCEECTLLGVNLGAFGFIQPFETMQEGLAVLDAMAATVGMEDFGIVQTTSGPCGQCGKDD